MPGFPLIAGIHELILDTRREARRRLEELASTFPNLPFPPTEAVPHGLPETCSDPPVCFRTAIPVLGFHYWSEGGEPLTSFLTTNGFLDAEGAQESCSLSERNKASLITPAIVRVGRKTCICAAAPKNGHAGGATQIWVERPQGDLFVLTK
jgi:hypothetical protein